MQVKPQITPQGIVTPYISQGFAAGSHGYRMLRTVSGTSAIAKLIAISSLPTPNKTELKILLI